MQQLLGKYQTKQPRPTGGMLDVRVEHEDGGGETTIRVTARGDGGFLQGERLRALLPLAALHEPALVEVDLSGVSHLCGYAMGLLVVLRRAVSGHGGVLRLSGVRPVVADAVRAARLDTLLEVEDPAAVACA